MLPSYPFLATGGSGSSIGPGDPIGLDETDPDTVVVYAADSDAVGPGGFTDDTPGASSDPIPCRVDDLRATRRVTGIDPHGLAEFRLYFRNSPGVLEDGQRIDWTGNVRGDLSPPLRLRSNGREVPPNFGEPAFFTVYATGRD